jgi:hypothetical protein
MQREGVKDSKTHIGSETARHWFDWVIVKTGKIIQKPVEIQISNLEMVEPVTGRSAKKSL